jgi:hypothetical protein
MKKTVSKYDFERAFKAMRPDNFSNAGLSELYDYLEQLEQDCDFELELDVIALCCDYSEDSLSNVLEDYGLESIEELRDNTTVIEIDSETVIFAQF